MLRFLREKLGFSEQREKKVGEIIRTIKTSHQAKLEEKIDDDLLKEALERKRIEDKAFLAAETCPECGCSCRHNRVGYGVDTVLNSGLKCGLNSKCVMCGSEWTVTYKLGSEN